MCAAVYVYVAAIATMHECNYDNMLCVQVVVECQLLDSLD